ERPPSGSGDTSPLRHTTIPEYRSTPTHITALGILIQMVVVMPQHINVIMIHFITLSHLDATFLGQGDPADRLLMVIKDNIPVFQPSNHFSRNIDSVSFPFHPPTSFAKSSRRRNPARWLTGRTIRRVIMVITLLSEV